MGIISGYLEKAIKRAFPAHCQTKMSSVSGKIVIDVRVSPEGFVPGLGQKAYLADVGMAAGRLYFVFSTPSPK